MLRSILCLLTFTSLLFAQGNPAALPWKPEVINGVPYVPIDQVKQFYGFDQMQMQQKQLTLENNSVKVAFTVGGHEVRLNGVKFFSAEPVILKNGKYFLSQHDLTTLLDPVLRPQKPQPPKLQKENIKTVILDPGHGGHDKGAAGLEAKYTLILAEQIKKMLVARGYAVALTREKNNFVPLAERIRLANKKNNAVFVSIHFNAGPKQVRGIETYIPSTLNGQGMNNNADNIALATAMHSRALLYLNNPKGNNFEMPDRGIRRARFNVFMNIKHPTVLIEGGYLSNKVDAGHIQDPIYQNTLASAIVRGIDVFKNTLR
ncbi:hypothetical protein NT6N_32840 [Oceaniferula spumae]|uniref:N-acetylmuramoyl-L-alanine amidase n=1 Tax=Oceaniferula spumae TaxID=2979115 RepID=A0AAT9FQG8_9BACT